MINSFSSDTDFKANVNIVEPNSISTVNGVLNVNNKVTIKNNVEEDYDGTKYIIPLRALSSKTDKSIVVSVGNETANGKSYYMLFKPQNETSDIGIWGFPAIRFSKENINMYLASYINNKLTIINNDLMVNI